jgi:hypothetical protein
LLDAHERRLASPHGAVNRQTLEVDPVLSLADVHSLDAARRNPHRSGRRRQDLCGPSVREPVLDELFVDANRRVVVERKERLAGEVDVEFLAAIAHVRTRAGDRDFTVRVEISVRLALRDEVARVALRSEFQRARQRDISPAIVVGKVERVLTAAVGRRSVRAPLFADLMPEKIQAEGAYRRNGSGLLDRSRCENRAEERGQQRRESQVA